MRAAVLAMTLLFCCEASFAGASDATILQTGVEYSQCLTVLTEGTRQTTRTDPCVWSSNQLWIYSQTESTLRPLSDPQKCLDATANIIAGQPTLYLQPCRNSILQKFQFSQNTCYALANRSLCIAHGAEDHDDLVMASCEKAIRFSLAPSTITHQKLRSLENLCLGSRAENVTLGNSVTGAFCGKSLAQHWSYSQQDGWMNLDGTHLCVSMYPGPMQNGQVLRFLPCRHTKLQEFGWAPASPIFVRSDPRLCLAIDGGIGGQAILVPCREAQPWFLYS